ncbi:MAG TPA: hypothetical protein VKQ32_29965 [Polyangia bacterium]|nr:hypothetical protein [Polyangia bacterium]
MSRLGNLAVVLAVAALVHAAPAHAAPEDAGGPTPSLPTPAVDDEVPPPPGRSPRAAVDDDRRGWPAPPVAADRRHFVGLSFVVRLPSGPGIDLSLYPLQRVELGVEISSWLILSESSVYARVAVLRHENQHHEDQSVTLGARFDTLLVVAGDADGDPTRKLVSAELGYTVHAGTFLFGAELGKTLVADGVWTGSKVSGFGGFSGEVRFGHLW